MRDRESGVDLGEIETAQNRKLMKMGFVLWSVLMLFVGYILGKQ